MSQTVTMTSTSSSRSLDSTTEEPVQSTSRAIHKFYEPIILYQALIDAVKHTAKPPSPEPSINMEDLKQVYYATMNKLSHVCNRERGGDNVTAFVALKYQHNPDRAQFVFTANRQTDSELEVTAAYVRSLLLKIHQAPDGEVNQHNARSSLLYHILRFNRPRVSFYLRNLRSQAAKCLESCQSTNTKEDRLIGEELKKILVCPSIGSDKDDLMVDYLRQSETMIQLLIRIDKTPAGAAIKARATEEQILGVPSMECWPKVFHTMSRIRAYPHRRLYFIESSNDETTSAKEPKSRRNYWANDRQTKEIQIFKRFVEELQVFDLDDRIQGEFKKESFKPVAHAEVLLLNWLLKPGEVAPEKFFNDWAYIGSGKPTCRLCVHYFQEHRSNVGHRPSHGNFYPSWRIPDIFPYQGKEAEKHKQVMVDRVLQRVRKDTFELVRKKASPSTKGEDSNTMTAGMTLDDYWSVRNSDSDDDDIDDLASGMGGVRLNS